MSDFSQDPAPVAADGTGHVRKGDDVARIDAFAKVTGRAHYAAEFVVPDMVFAVVVNSTIAKGRITALHVDAAKAVPGVLDVLSHLNRPRSRKLDLFYKDMTAPAGSPFKVFHSDGVLYSGQPIALVVAETFEVARYAASLVTAEYETEPHVTNLLRHLSAAHKPAPIKFGFTPPPDERGDSDAAYGAAPAQVDSTFWAGPEHHNPMEMHATTVLRGEDGHMTIYDKTQGSQNSRWYVSRVFGIPARKVTVMNPYVGGAFGSGLRPQYNLPLAVMASLMLKRSVRLVLTRQQMFTFGHRPETWQRVRLGAERDGTLTSVLHEAIAETSRLEDYVEVVVNWSAQLYRCDNVRLGYQLVDLDQYSPMDMRAPGAAHGVNALEIAMDELSYELGMDPLALRLKNYTDIDPIRKVPFSTKELKACYSQGAERFGWSKRAPLPRARKEGHEWVGWGMATGTWDALQMFARARAVLHADGRLEVESAATDIGTGTYTVMCQIAAAAMGLPMEHVTFRLGDSRLPVAPIEGGSAHTATVGAAVEGVCDKLKKQLLKLAGAMDGSRFHGRTAAQVEFGPAGLQMRGQPDTAISLADIVRASGHASIEDKYLMLPAVLKQQKYMRAVHSAVFVEVRVDEELGVVRVTRVVSAIAAGQIMSARTARSQVVGGIVWGISQALHEETHTDHRLGRFMNHNFSEYHVAANADIHDIDVIFVAEDDRIVSRMGAKGVGEIGIVGVPAAISNAIYHATGRRVHSTPITPEKVMKASAEWPGGDAGVGIEGERADGISTQYDFADGAV